MSIVEFRSCLEEEYKRISKIAVELGMAKGLIAEMEEAKLHQEEVEECQKDLDFSVRELDMALTDLKGAIEELKNVRI